jgi:phosphoribosylglycinamide formyltransferase 1
LIILKVLRVLNEYNIHFIVLAGFLLKIPKNILDAYPEGIVNIHPAFCQNMAAGECTALHVHEAAISSGDRFSGITIHMINEEYDKGSIVSQHTCEIRHDDTPQSLAERIHKLEHYWYPRIIEKLLVGDF